MSQRPPLINRVFGKIAQAIAIRWRHFKKYQIDGEWEGLKLVRRVWKVRPLGRIGLAALVVGSILAATQIEARVAQRAARFAPLEPLRRMQTYTATVTTEVKDNFGHALATNYTWRFETEFFSLYLPLTLKK